jgi:hypothetical protein
MMSFKSNELTDMYAEKNAKSFHTVMNSETRHRVWTGNCIYNSKQQVIIVLSLIHTFCNSLQQAAGTSCI